MNVRKIRADHERDNGAGPGAGARVGSELRHFVLFRVPQACWNVSGACCDFAQLQPAGQPLVVMGVAAAAVACG